MRHAIAAVAIVLASAGAIPATVDAGPNQCHKNAVRTSGGWTVATVRCFSVQDSNNMFRAVLRFFRTDTNSFYRLRGPWRSCDGAKSTVSFPTGLDIWVSFHHRIRADHVHDGC